MKNPTTTRRPCKGFTLIPGLRTFWLSLAMTIYPFATLPAEQFGNFTYAVINGSQVEITDYPAGQTGAVIVPSEIHGMPVTSIGNQAFRWCDRLASVTLPDGVSSVGNYAFANCSGLKTVIFGDGLTMIGEWAFAICVSLSEAAIPDGVTSIGVGAFNNCSSMRTISISRNVTFVGDWAFNNCGNLTTITVDPGNRVYASIDGMLLNKNQTRLIKCPGGYPGSCTIPPTVTTISDAAFRGSRALMSVTIPDSVVEIGQSAFRDCDDLTDVVIPASVNSIGNYAFSYCNNLASAIFAGDAPIMGDNVFSNAAPGFSVTCIPGSAGFTSPTWEGYQTVEIDEETCPAARWLLTHGLRHDTDLRQDHNGDAVSLLAAYALNLDPSNPQPGMPAPALDPATMRLTFHGAAPGVTYSAETSTDCQVWTTEGVTVSDLDADNMRTATVGRDSARRFLRLRFNLDP